MVIVDVEDHDSSDDDVHINSLPSLAPLTLGLAEGVESGRGLAATVAGGGMGLSDLPECLLLAIYALVPELMREHRGVNSKFRQNLCPGAEQSLVRLHLHYDTGRCSAERVPKLPLFLKRNEHCDVEIQISSYCSAGAITQPDRAHREIFDAILDAASPHDRDLTQLTRLAVHTHFSARVFTLPYDIIAAIMVCNTRMSSLSLKGMPFESAGLRVLGEAVQLGGLELRSLELEASLISVGVEALEPVLPSLTSLDLSHLDLSGTGASMLTRALLRSSRSIRDISKNNSGKCVSTSGNSSGGGDDDEVIIRKLRLKDCKLGPIEMIPLQQLLARATRLESLDLSCNALNSIGLAQVLHYTCYSRAPTLHALLYAALYATLYVLYMRLASLDLRCNALNSIGRRQVAGTFSHLGALRELDLFCTGGVKHGLAIVAGALHTLTCLETLRLSAIAAVPTPAHFTAKGSGGGVGALEGGGGPVGEEGGEGQPEGGVAGSLQHLQHLQHLHTQDGGPLLSDALACMRTERLDCLDLSDIPLGLGGLAWLTQRDLKVKMQALTSLNLASTEMGLDGTQFSFFTRTKVQILTPQKLGRRVLFGQGAGGDGVPPPPLRYQVYLLY